MQLGKLVRDPTLLPALPRSATVNQQAEHDARADFLLRRGKSALATNIFLPGNGPGEVMDDAVGILTAQLKTEVDTAAAKMATLTAAMADPSKTELLPIDDKSVDPAKRFKNTYMSLFRRTPEQLRATAIVSAGWSTLAADLTLSDADLHSLVSRRLLMTERMLWYVGRPESRSWDFAGTDRKEWQDGWNRMFEYGRLPSLPPFSSLCNPAKGQTACDVKGQMAGWDRRPGGQFRHDIQVNPAAAAEWIRHGDDDLFFKRAGGTDPAKAILDVFTPAKRFDRRNFLYCDQTICCLHLESLVRVKSKRDGNRAWVKNLTDKESDGWLRIISPGVWAGGAAFLVGDRDARYFVGGAIDASELMVGDHVVVTNHPAYEMAMESSDVWRLENALVVATSPRLLLQGHGTNPLPFTAKRRIPLRDDTAVEESMRLNMLSLFNKKLKKLRALAEKENAKAKPRLEIDFDSRARLAQRTDVGSISGFNPSDFTLDVAKKARWWIRWDAPDTDHQQEKGILADRKWAEQTWAKSLVELTGTHGWFPLWLPRTEKGKPVRTRGKISALQAVFVSQEMAAGWSWYYGKDEPVDEGATHRLYVRRPRVS